MTDILVYGNILIFSFFVILTGTESLGDKCPSQCSGSCLGNIVNCAKRDLRQVPKDIPIWCVQLNLKSNQISVLNADYFKNLSSITNLDVSHNRIAFINESLFDHLPRLQVLKITHNKLIHIPAPRRLTKIIRLKLGHNEIRSLKGVTRYKSLKTLDLSFNFITSVTPGLFLKNNSLRRLYLQSNRILIIENQALDNLSNLEVLKLSRNQISYMSKNIFANLKSLQILELNQNRLHVLDALSFNGSRKLNVLKLRRNSIRKIKDAAFYGLDSISELYLDHNNITSIKKNWMFGLKSLKLLSLAYNQITSIEEWKFIESLKKLYLSHNNLVKLLPRDLLNLESLQIAYFDHNLISHIDREAFAKLSDLEQLNLDSNQVFWTLEDTESIFNGLKKLRILSLRNNSIKTITKSVFTGLDSIENIDLRHNDITTVEENPFGSTFNLKHLSINTTHLLCDCNLAWLPHWLESSGFRTEKNMVVCVYPEYYKGKSIYSIEKGDYKCKNEPPKPFITVHPKSLIATPGQNISLDCEAWTRDSYSVTYQWRMNDLIMRNAETEVKVSHEKGITSYRSRLFFRHVRDNQSAPYQCVVSNQFGSAYSDRAELSVRDRPRFVKKPIDMKVKIGEMARFECIASGSPTPRIRWNKDGGENFPAARERRLKYIPDDPVMFIKPTMSIDEGTYTCIAENLVGAISANATLTITGTNQSMKNKVTSVGQTSVLVCPIKNNHVQWFVDNHVLVTTERHFITAKGQVLVIINSQLTDAGIYTCKVAGKFGIRTRSTMLSVIGQLSANSRPLSPTTAHWRLNSGNSPDVGGDPANEDVDDSTTTEIIIIVVVSCIVGTSVVWLIIIYWTRLRNPNYSSNTDDAVLARNDQIRNLQANIRNGVYSRSLNYLVGHANYNDCPSEGRFCQINGRHKSFVLSSHSLLQQETSDEELQRFLPNTRPDHRQHSPISAVYYSGSLSTGSTHVSGIDTPLRSFHPSQSLSALQENNLSPGQGYPSPELPDSYIFNEPDLLPSLLNSQHETEKSLVISNIHSEDAQKTFLHSDFPNDTKEDIT